MQDTVHVMTTLKKITHADDILVPSLYLQMFYNITIDKYCGFSLINAKHISRGIDNKKI